MANSTSSALPYSTFIGIIKNSAGSAIPRKMSNISPIHPLHHGKPLLVPMPLKIDPYFLGTFSVFTDSNLRINILI